MSEVRGRPLIIWGGGVMQKEKKFVRGVAINFFFAVAKGGPEKLVMTRDHKQTAPLPVKNDNSPKGETG